MKKLFLLFSVLWLLSFCLVPAGSAQSIAPGTEIKVQLLSQLDTGKTQPDQYFSATLAEPVRLANQAVWPKGTEVTGKVIEVVSSGRLKQPASITLQLTAIAGSPVETNPEQIDGQSHAGRNVALIGGGTAAGAVLGAVAGGGKGALIGSLVGAGVGTATAAATGKQEIVLRAESPLSFVIAGESPKQLESTGPPPAPESPETAQPQGQYQDADRYEPYAPEQLDNLLAPVALYPDPLLAQVLVATTFPDQIQDAAQWIRGSDPNDIDDQPWDVSVKAVAHYPTVLGMLDDRLDWSTALGQAYVNQSTDVMMSVGRLRNLAYSQGNLVTTPEQRVVRDQGYIQIVPVQPRVIFVPVYDPGVIYVRRVYRPGVGFGGFYTFGTGYAIGAWLNYDLDWHSNRVIYDGWDGRRGGWREQSRPYVRVTNVYVNNRYEQVNVNRTVVNRHVNYENVERYNSVHRDVTYENHARFEANRGRSEPPRADNQRRPDPPNGRLNSRSNDDGFRNRPPAQVQPPQSQRPTDARFGRPNPPERVNDRGVNDRGNDRDNGRGYGRGNDKGSSGFGNQPPAQAQPPQSQRPSDARFERPNPPERLNDRGVNDRGNNRDNGLGNAKGHDKDNNSSGNQPPAPAQAQPPQSQRPRETSFERPNPTPPSAQLPRPQSPIEKANDRGSDAGPRNQPPARIEQPARNASQPAPQAAPAAPPASHSVNENRPNAPQQEEQQRQHGAGNNGNKNKDKDKN